MFLPLASVLALAAYMPLLVSGCIQVHTYLKTQGIVGEDIMAIQVWVNGRSVCEGSDKTFISTSETVFSLQNGDGKGTGCAPGYSILVKDNGRDATFHYWENGNIVWTTYLNQGPTKSETYDCQPCHESQSGETTCAKCWRFETALSVHPCDNVKPRGLCDLKASCDTRLPIDPPNPFPFTPKKVMVVGDSISHGADADWTWRYHAWQWLKDQSYDVQFVGPSVGTHGPGNLNTARPSPPLLPGESEPTYPDIVGSYASGVPSGFTASGHASRWGRQAAQITSQIEGWVRQYQPDYILMLLGFNDLGWWVSGPDGLLSTMENLVNSARRGNPNVKFAIGNVVERLFIDGRQDLVDNTRDYNNKLRQACTAWSRYANTFTAYVDVAAQYNCRPGGCPDGYDGLHPNAMGELHIAKAFADVLAGDQFLLKGRNFVAGSPAPRPVSKPTNFRMSAVNLGLLMSWDRQPNARGYNIRLRIKGATGWWSDGPVYPDANLSYFTWCLKGQEWEAQVAARGDNNALTEWSNILSATCNPQTSPGPSGIVVQPSGSDSISFRWAAVTGYSVNRYSAIIWDKDTPGAFIDQRATTGTSITISGLKKGHRYGCWVQTWVNLADGTRGGGLPAAAREVLVGMGAPAVVSSFKVVNKDPTTVELSWNAVANAGGYQILTRLKSDPGKVDIATTTETSYGIAFLFPGTWNFEFCVQSYNGNLQAACTSFITPPKWPGFKRTIGASDMRRSDAAPLKLKDNTTALFLHDESLPHLWEQLATGARMEHEVGSVNVTSMQHAL